MDFGLMGPWERVKKKSEGKELRGFKGI